MTNVVALKPQTLVQEVASPLMFKAYERPLWYEGQTGTKYDNTKHKALVRMGDNGPVCLNVVNNSYKVVQNQELFEAIDNGMHKVLTSKEISNAEIVDNMSFGGAKCFRKYVFKNIAVESPERDTICFQIIIENGFGTGAIKLHAGAIDFFCTNGMILGEYTSVYAKHTTGVQIQKFEHAVEMAVDVFWKNRNLWADMRKKRLKGTDEVHAWLKEKFSERLGTKLFHQYLIETRVRGGNTMWALYSALTHYASHEKSFPTRATLNDHTAATMVKRQIEVHKVYTDTQFLEIAA